MHLTELFDENMIELHGEFSSQTNFFKKISSRLQELQYVKEEFCNKIQEREKKFPTGLVTKSFDVAIPHTDPEYVNRSFVYVIRLTPTLAFCKMGTDPMEHELVYPKLIFLLGVNKGELQLTILQSLMKLFSNEKQMSSLLEIKEKNSFLQHLQKYLSTNEI